MRIYVVIFFATLATVVAPVPEEASLLAAGFAARLDRAAFWGCAGAGWSAVMLGDAFAFFVGRALLPRLLRTRWGERIVPRARRLWAERLVAARGVRAIVLARFLVGLRGFVYFAVGASGYPFGRFLAVNGAVGLLEVSGLVAVGFAFGNLHARVGRWIDLIAAAILLLAFLGPPLVRALTRKGLSVED